MPLKPRFTDCCANHTKYSVIAQLPQIANELSQFDGSGNLSFS